MKIFKLLSKVTVLFVLLSMFVVPLEIKAATWETRKIIFPVIGTVTYYDDFGAPRDGGARSHEGNDLMGKKMLPLVAAVDGRVNVSYPQETWGYSVTIRDEDDYTYHYLHINNDHPGTDDGTGDGMFAYAPDVNDGMEVVAGQLIGWMGDSGNAETTTAHLHFEIRRPDRSPISPYNSLKAATKITTPIERPIQDDEILPFGGFEGGAFIAAGNLDSDSGTEIVIGAGPGGGPHVKVMNENGTIVRDFFAYDMKMTGGVDVAVGDLDDDGKNEIITAPASKSQPLVKIFNSAGEKTGEFMAYDPKFLGGVNVTTADIDDDDKAEIITAPGKGGGPHIRAFKPDGTEVLTFFAYDGAFAGGVDIAAYANGDDVYIVTAPGPGMPPTVKVFDEDGDMTEEFDSYDSAHMGGVRVSISRASSRRSRPQIVTVPLSGGPQAKRFSLSGTLQGTDWGFEQWWNASWDITIYQSKIYMSSNANSKRRASVRLLDFRTTSTRSR